MAVLCGASMTSAQATLPRKALRQSRTRGCDVTLARGVRAGVVMTSFSTQSIRKMNIPDSHVHNRETDKSITQSTENHNVNHP